jgi:nicotinamidase-related amidase
MESTALIVVDMLNRYDHDDAEPLIASVEQQLPTISRLVQAAQDHDVLTVYVNDNYGDWSANAAKLSDNALEGRRPDLVEPIVPAAHMPFVIKARHSIFYETPVEYLLRQERIERVVLTGQVTEQCILYSALDAYVRHFEVTIARDAVAHIHEDLAESALRMMELNMRAAVVDAEDVFRLSGARSG